MNSAPGLNLQIRRGRAALSGPRKRATQSNAALKAPLCHSILQLRLLISFFRLLVKRRRHHSRFHALSANFYIDARPHLGEPSRNVRQRDVLLEERPRRATRHVTDFAATVVEHLVTVASNSTLDHLHSDQRPLQP